MKKILELILTKKIVIAYLLLLFVMISSAMLSVACSQVMIHIVDNLTGRIILGNLIKGLLVYLAFSIVQSVVNYFQTVLLGYLNEYTGVELKKQIVDCLFSKPLDYFNRKKTGDLQQVLITDVLSVTSFFTDTLLSIVSNVFTGLAVIIYLALLQWELLLIVLALQPFLMFIQSVFGNKTNEKSELYRESLGETVSFSQEIITNIVQYIAFGLRGFCQKKYEKIQKKSAFNAVKVTEITTLSTTCISGISVVMFILIFGFGGYKVTIGAMSLGMLIAFVQFSQDLLDPFIQLFSIKIEYEQIKPSLKRIENIMSRELDCYGEISSGIKGNLEFQNVTFSYSKREPILNSVSAIFEKGKMYCFVGKSGSGKTTICNLILRLCQPQSGRILIDDIPINDIDELYFYNNVTYIAQIPFVFNGTIKDNICLDKEVTEEDFQAAIKFSGLQEDLKKLPNRENYQTSDCGGNLSVGQRQRIGLARAYIRNSPIIIFDEPTASIGQEYTKWFIEQINDYKKDHLVIIVSHDEEVANCCDVIYRLNQNGTLEKL